MKTSLIINNHLPDTVFKVGKIYLDQVEIIEIPNITQEYSFEVDVPYWHRHFKLVVWEYIGNNQNTIDRKLDDLLGNP